MTCQLIHLLYTNNIFHKYIHRYIHLQWKLSIHGKYSAKAFSLICVEEHNKKKMWVVTGYQLMCRFVCAYNTHLHRKKNSLISSRLQFSVYGVCVHHYNRRSYTFFISLIVYSGAEIIIFLEVTRAVGMKRHLFYIFCLAFLLYTLL